jgi:hypothetical protein
LIFCHRLKNVDCILLPAQQRLGELECLFGCDFPGHMRTALRVSLAVTPAEYIFLYPKGDWRNDYNARIGLSFSLGHR